MPIITSAKIANRHQQEDKKPSRNNESAILLNHTKENSINFIQNTLNTESQVDHHESNDRINSLKHFKDKAKKNV